MPPGTVFGGEPNGRCEIPSCGPLFQGASPDLSHVVLSSPAQLTATPAPAGEEGLYEWSAGSLQLVDVLPQGEAGPAILAGSGTNVAGKTGIRGSVSDDGQRVVLEGGADGGEGLYLRDVAAGETTRLDVPQGGSGPSEKVDYMDANGDASRVFFLDSGRLTSDSSADGADLYEYNLNAPPGSRLTDLTPDRNAGQAANVAMMLGAGGDGSYVYFAAAGALAPGAVDGECEGQRGDAKEGSRGCNLYVRHKGVTRLVAVLPSADFYDWSKELHGEYGKGLYARVSPNGRWLAFMSAAELTGYDTHDAISGRRDLEVYLYHASADSAEAGALVCASCDPTGARPLGMMYGSAGVKSREDATEFSGEWVAGSVPSWTGSPAPGEFDSSHAVHQPRYLSDSGRLFFDSTDALVPQDVDGTEDVYEYEPAGVGACGTASATFSPRSNGCVSLISAGTSPEESTFLDASETGGDVFFMTVSRLAAQDYDTAYDVYDAHECSGAAPCSAAVPQPPACDTEASCKAAPTPQPALYGAPASATFSGTGNLTTGTTPVVKPKAKPRPRRKSAPCRKHAERHRCRKAKRSTRGRRGGAR